MNVDRKLGTRTEDLETKTKGKYKVQLMLVLQKPLKPNLL